MITVGLDMSLTSTGHCVLTDGVFSTKTIKTKPHDFANDLDRFRFIVDTTMDMIPQNTDLICIEDFFVPASRAQFNAAIVLVQLGALVRNNLYERGTPFVVVSPSQLKKWILGKGNGQKSLIIRGVYKAFDLDVKDDNQADAAVLAAIARDLVEWHSTKKLEGAAKYREETIRTVYADRPQYHWWKSDGTD